MNKEEVNLASEKANEQVIMAAQQATMKVAEPVVEANVNNISVPTGYLEIEAPTEGRLYAPAKYHVKNLAAEDLLGMALSDDEMLPIHTIDIFNGLVLEDGIDIGGFQEDEVICMLFDIYTKFYSTMIKDHKYKLQDSDYKFLANQLGGEESDAYRKKIRDYKTGRWTPTIDIDLTKIKKLKLPADFKPAVRVERKSTGFSCIYGFPKYGDIRTVKNFLDSTYRQQDDLYSGLTSTLSYRRDQIQKREDGADIAFESIPNLTSTQSKEYDRYTYDRNITLMKAIRANNLLEYRGKDVSGLSIGQKLDIAEDPEFDLPVYKAISKKIEATPIGLEKTIKVISPVTNEEIDYPFNFRVFDLLQAIQSADSGDLEVSYS